MDKATQLKSIYQAFKAKIKAPSIADTHTSVKQYYAMITERLMDETQEAETAQTKNEKLHEALRAKEAKLKKLIARNSQQRPTPERKARHQKALEQLNELQHKIARVELDDAVLTETVGIGRLGHVPQDSQL